MVEMSEVLFGIKSDKYVQLVVEDDGIIVNKDTDKIFFSSPTEKYIKDDNGDVYVESKTTKSGSQFYYTLHSEEVYNKRIEKCDDMLGHARYKKV